MADLFGKVFKDHLVELLKKPLAGLPAGWARTEDLVTALDAMGDVWGDYEKKGLLEAKKALVRRYIKQLSEDGHQLVHSIERACEGGSMERVYKQETLFEVDDYKQAYIYHRGRQSYHVHIADDLRERCKKRYGVDCATSDDLPE